MTLRHVIHALSATWKRTCSKESEINRKSNVFNVEYWFITLVMPDLLHILKIWKMSCLIHEIHSIFNDPLYPLCITFYEKYYILRSILFLLQMSEHVLIVLFLLHTLFLSVDLIGPGKLEKSLLWYLTISLNCLLFCRFLLFKYLKNTLFRDIKW